MHDDLSLRYLIHKFLFVFKIDRLLYMKLSLTELLKILNLYELSFPIWCLCPDQLSGSRGVSRLFSFQAHIGKSVTDCWDWDIIRQL